MDCSLPGSSVRGILQARILEWVAMLSSMGSSQPKDPTQVSRVAGRFLTIWATWEALCHQGSSHLFLKFKLWLCKFPKHVAGPPFLDLIPTYPQRLLLAWMTWWLWFHFETLGIVQIKARGPQGQGGLRGLTFLNLLWTWLKRILLTESWYHWVFLDCQLGQLSHSQDSQLALHLLPWMGTSNGPLLSLPRRQTPGPLSSTCRLPPSIIPAPPHSQPHSKAYLHCTFSEWKAQWICSSYWIHK